MLEPASGAHDRLSVLPVRGGEVRYCVAVTSPLQLADVRNEKDALMASTTGTIKRLTDKGFGFIKDDGGQEWFFHRSSVEGSFEGLNEGQRVSFEEEPSAKGPRAGNVRGEG